MNVPQGAVRAIRIDTIKPLKQRGIVRLSGRCNGITYSIEVSRRFIDYYSPQVGDYYVRDNAGLEYCLSASEFESAYRFHSQTA